LFVATAAQAQEDVSFKVDVSLVTLLVNVKDERGAPIANLEPRDFTVLDGGVEREIAVFERRTDRPLSVALMVDASLSAAKELPYEREAAKRFLANFSAPAHSPPIGRPCSSSRTTSICWWVSRVRKAGSPGAQRSPRR
jgi:hypothetical protein